MPAHRRARARAHTRTHTHTNTHTHKYELKPACKVLLTPKPEAMHRTTLLDSSSNPDLHTHHTTSILHPSPCQQYSGTSPQKPPLKKHPTTSLQDHSFANTSFSIRLNGPLIKGKDLYCLIKDHLSLALAVLSAKVPLYQPIKETLLASLYCVTPASLYLCHTGLTLPLSFYPCLTCAILHVSHLHPSTCVIPASLYQCHSTYVSRVPLYLLHLCHSTCVIPASHLHCSTWVTPALFYLGHTCITLPVSYLHHSTCVTPAALYLCHKRGRM